MPLEVIVCVLGNRNTLGVLYISYSVVDDHNMKGSDSTVQGITKHTPT